MDKNGIEIVNVNGVAFEPFAKLYNSNNIVKRLPSRCSILTDNDKGLIAPNHFINIENGITKVIAKKIFLKLKELELIDNSNRIGNYNPDVDIELGDLVAYDALIKQCLNNKVNQISDRAVKAISYSNGNLLTFPAEITFEYELMIASEVNYQIIFNTYKDMHPRLTPLPLAEPISKRALSLLNKINANKDKSELSQKLSFLLETRIVFRAAFKSPKLY
ncbi:MAG: hypothetical protein IPL10_06545 [Bacteroidetes bacterium]|nr:hypothetical protein [Bacteroidota bacterium]